MVFDLSDGAILKLHTRAADRSGEYVAHRLNLLYHDLIVLLVFHDDVFALVLAEVAEYDVLEVLESIPFEMINVQVLLHPFLAFGEGLKEVVKGGDDVGGVDFSYHSVLFLALRGPR